MVWLVLGVTAIALIASIPLGVWLIKVWLDFVDPLDIPAEYDPNWWLFLEED